MFEFIIMQATPIENISAIILALGAIATVIGHYLSTNDKFKKYGVYLTTFGQKTTEQEGNIAAVAEAATALSPEAKAVLDKYNVQLTELRRRAEIAEAQLAKLQPTIPEKAQADNKTDLPR